MTYLLEKFAGRKRFFKGILWSYVTFAFIRAWFSAGTVHAESAISDTVHDVFSESHTDSPYVGKIFAGGGGCAGSGSTYAQSYYQATYYSQGSYYAQGTYQTNVTLNTSAKGTFSVTGSISKSTGTFVIDDPLDPKNKLLYHSFVESPDAKNLYDGIAVLDSQGEATITLPDYFDALNMNLRYELKPVGAPMPNLHVKTEEKDNRFVIAGGAPAGRVSWQMTGVRHDAYILANPILPVVDKGPGQLVDKGQYLFQGSADRSSLLKAIDWIRGIFHI